MVKANIENDLIEAGVRIKNKITKEHDFGTSEFIRYLSIQIIAKFCYFCSELALKSRKMINYLLH